MYRMYNNNYCYKAGISYGIKTPGGCVVESVMEKSYYYPGFLPLLPRHRLLLNFILINEHRVTFLSVYPANESAD